MEMTNDLLDFFPVYNLPWLNILSLEKWSDTLKEKPVPIKGNMEEVLDKMFNNGMTFFKN